LYVLFTYWEKPREMVRGVSMLNFKYTDPNKCIDEKCVEVCPTLTLFDTDMERLSSSILTSVWYAISV
jgi:Fe-S-cluster-containing hydrogenase component 2